MLQNQQANKRQLACGMQIFFLGDIVLLGGYILPRDVYSIVYTEIFCAVLPSTIIANRLSKSDVYSFNSEVLYSFYDCLSPETFIMWQTGHVVNHLKIGTYLSPWHVQTTHVKNSQHISHRQNSSGSKTNGLKIWFARWYGEFYVSTTDGQHSTHLLL